MASLPMATEGRAGGSKVVAYWDFNDVPLLGATAQECPFCRGHIMGDRAGRNCSTTYACGPSPFLSALQRTFPAALAVHDVTNGAPGTTSQRRHCHFGRK